MFRRFSIVLIILTTACIGWAQERWLYPPAVFEPDDLSALAEVRRLTNLHQHEAARDICLRLADENAGTSLGATALEGAEMAELFNGNAAGAQQVRQRIIEEYPDSRFEIRARFSNVSELVPNSNPEEKLTVFSDFLENRGAPRLEAILAGQNLEQAALQMQSFHPEVRYELAVVYGLSVSLVEDPEQAVNLAKFGRMAFGTVSLASTSFAVSLKTALKRWRGKELGDEASRPTITVVSPAPDSTVGTQPVIRFRMTSGDYRKAQIDLAHLSFKLDEIDQNLSASVNLDIDDTLTEGVDFEVLTVSLSPTLSEGLHTVDVSAYAGFGSTPENSASLSWSFTVSDTPPEPTSVTLPTTQDSTLRAKKPHRNEGANPRLFLSHRLEARGKSQNPIVGFDLASEDLTGLTKATLVMNIQDCDLPRRWGQDGRSIIACPVNEPWVEGNGNKYRVQGSAGKTKGEGQGVTWFSPVDEKIQNNRPNGSVQWDGARSVTGQPTAPPVLLVNGQTGNVEFDVTQDVLAGFQDGWVIKKQDEAKFGNIRFYSKEGAGGDAELTPRLILEFGSSTAQNDAAQSDGVLARLGFGRGKLKSKPGGSELPSIREQLQESPVAAYAGETLVGAMAGPNPALKMASKVAYRSWLGSGLG